MRFFLFFLVVLLPVFLTFCPSDIRALILFLPFSLPLVLLSLDFLKILLNTDENDTETYLFAFKIMSQFV